MIIILLWIGIVIAVVAIIYQLIYGKDVREMNIHDLIRYMRVYLSILLISIIFTSFGVFL